MRKILFLVLITAIIGCMMACGENIPSTEPQSDDVSPSSPVTTEKFENKEIDIKGLKASMISSFSPEGSIEVTADLLLNLYGIKEDQIDECACYMTMDGVFPQEVIMIKAKDEESQKSIRAALEKRILEVKEQSKNYDPENYALAQKCEVGGKGLYITMFLSPNYGQMTEMFNAAFAG